MDSRRVWSLVTHSMRAKRSSSHSSRDQRWIYADNVLWGNLHQRSRCEIDNFLESCLPGYSNAAFAGLVFLYLYIFPKFIKV